VSHPFTTIVIPTWNGRALMPPCLDALRLQTSRNFEVMVVDGGSSDGTVDMLRADYQEVKALALDQNLGFTGNVNAGIRAAQSEFIALLNNDATAAPDWIEQLAGGLANDPRRGSCASLMLRADAPNIVDSAGDLLGRNGLAQQRGAGEPLTDRFREPLSVFSACGGAAIYRKSMLDDVGLLDPGYVSYLEDVDLGVRAQLRGWGCQYIPTARVYHQGSATGGGVTASFYVARNSIRLIARGFPTSVIRRSLRRMAAAQLARASDAAKAWRGKAARATLQGLLAGLRDLPDALRGRDAIQRGRTISDEAFSALLDSF
jgi:GT2 family glycosyltransferase